MKQTPSATSWPSSLKGGLKIRIIRSEPQCFRKCQYMSAVYLPNLWVMTSSRPNRIFRFFCLSSCSDNIQICFSRYSWQSRMPPFSKRSLISSAKRLFVLSIRFLHLSEKGQSLTARDPLVRERCKLSTSKNRPQWDFRNCFPAKRALRPGVIFASLASADALRRLASYSALSDPLPATPNLRLQSNANSLTHSTIRSINSTET